MAAPNYTFGIGSQIWVSTTSGGTYAKIAQSKDLVSPDAEVKAVNITNNDSPNFSLQYAAGMKDPGKVSFEWIYTKAQQATLYGYWNAVPSTTLYFKEIFRDGGGFSFSGFVTKIGVETKTDNEINMGKVEIQLVTSPVFAAELTESSGSSESSQSSVSG